MSSGKTSRRKQGNHLTGLTPRKIRRDAIALLSARELNETAIAPPPYPIESWIRCAERNRVLISQRIEPNSDAFGSVSDLRASYSLIAFS